MKKEFYFLCVIPLFLINGTRHVRALYFLVILSVCNNLLHYSAGIDFFRGGRHRGVCNSVNSGECAKMLGVQASADASVFLLSLLYECLPSSMWELSYFELPKLCLFVPFRSKLPKLLQCFKMGTEFSI